MVLPRQRGWCFTRIDEKAYGVAVSFAGVIGKGKKRRLRQLQRKGSAQLPLAVQIVIRLCLTVAVTAATLLLHTTELTRQQPCCCTRIDACGSGGKNRGYDQRSACQAGNSTFV